MTIEYADVKEQVVTKGAWYLKYRTTIWGVVWFCVGLFGGNVDRAQEYIPTLKYSTPEIQQKLNEYNELLEKARNLKKEIDAANSEEV